MSFHSAFSKKFGISARMPPNAEYHILGENSEIGDELRKTEPTSVFSGPHLPLEALIWLKIGTESTNQENRRQKISFSCPPSVATYLETSIIDNPPSFLRSRPRDNQIIVNIRQNLATQTTAYTPLPTRYTLILSFEQLDDDEI